MKGRSHYGSPEARYAADITRRTRLIESGGMQVCLRLPAEYAGRLKQLAAAAGIAPTAMATRILIEKLGQM
jgi:hypothetical protein